MAGGLGLTLPDILRLRAAASAGERKDTAVIQIWLGGGISQFESWDPKPDAPKEIRGPWKPIPTKLPGVQFCELLPRHAQVADKMAILRSVWHKDSGHAGGTTVCATGKPQAGHPSTGSVTARLRGANGYSRFCDLYRAWKGKLKPSGRRAGWRCIWPVPERALPAA